MELGQVAQLTIYVYRVSENEYGAGFGESGCRKRGDIVEVWPVHTPDLAKFTARHGTAYFKASEKVAKLADIAYELLTRDPTFLEEPEKVKSVHIEIPRPRKSWFSWFRRSEA